MFTPLQVHEIIDFINGTCRTLSEVCELFGGTEDDLGPDGHMLIDDEIFECEVCGWWFEVAEQGEDDDRQVCLTCAES